MKHRLAAFLSGCLVAAPASAAELTVIFGGMPYDGPPQYEILADGAVVASGVVTEPTGQAVTVALGEPLAIAIRYVNDLAAPKGPDGKRAPGADRNLVIEAVTLNGTTLPGKALLGPRGVVRAGEFAIVAVNQTVDIPIGRIVAAALR